MTPSEAKLEAARLEGALVAARTMRHYLNNRLALTVGYMEIIADDPQVSDQVRELAGKAIAGARSASLILKKLQHVQRVELDPEWIGPSILDLAKLDLGAPVEAPISPAPHHPHTSVSGSTPVARLEKPRQTAR